MAPLLFLNPACSSDSSFPVFDLILSNITAGKTLLTYETKAMVYTSVISVMIFQLQRLWFDMYSALSTQRALQIVMYVCVYVCVYVQFQLQLLIFKRLTLR